MDVVNNGCIRHVWDDPVAAEKLIDKMEIKDFLSNLTQNKVITESEMREIQTDYDDICQSILQRLSEMPEGVRETLISDLSREAQYRRHRNDQKEEQEPDETIDTLITEIGIRKLLFHLRDLEEKELIRTEDMREIQNKFIGINRRFLNMISRKSETGKRSFKIELQRSGQLYHLIGDIIDGNYLTEDPFCNETCEIANIKRYESGFHNMASSIPLIFPNCYDYDENEKQLIRIAGVQDDGNLKIYPKAIEMIRKFENPLSVLGIVGPTRTGKSFLLSTMMGEANSFQVTESTDPGTIGIWIGTSYLQGHLKDGKPFSILMLDSVGTGSMESTNHSTDTILATLMLLLCSTFVYNTETLPREPDMKSFKKYANIATKLLNDCGENLDNSLLPKVLWVLRNVTADLPPTFRQGIREAFSQLPGYQQREGLNGGDQCDGMDLYELPCPSTERYVIRDLIDNKDRLDITFKKELAKLRLRIYQVCCAKQKSAFGGTNVTGGLFADMLTNYVDQLNNNSVASIIQAFKFAKDAEHKRKVEILIQVYISHIEAQFQTHTLNNQKPLEEVDNTDRGNRNVNQAQNDGAPTLLQIHEEAYKIVLVRVQADDQILEADRNDIISMLNLQIVFPQFDMSELREHWASIRAGALNTYKGKNEALSKNYLQELQTSADSRLNERIFTSKGALCTESEFQEHLNKEIENIERAAIGPHNRVEVSWVTNWKDSLQRIRSAFKVANEIQREKLKETILKVGATMAAGGALISFVLLR